MTNTIEGEPHRAAPGARSIVAAALCIAATALMLCGCGASGPAYSQVNSSAPQLDPSKGRIYVYRTYNYVGGASSPFITLNGGYLGRSVAGGYFYADLPPGNYHMESFATFLSLVQSVGQQTFSLKAGQSLYVRSILTSIHELDLVPPDQAAAEISGLSYTGVGDVSEFRANAKVVEMADSAFGNFRQTSGMEFAPPPMVAPVASGISPNLASSMYDASNASSNAGTSAGWAVASPSSPSAEAPVPQQSGPVADTPDEAESLLAADEARTPGGLYSAESSLQFNVLDYVALDPATGSLSLVGHSDPSFKGPRIPYLQYLSTLLESPKPEFTLTMTPDSSDRIDAMFNQTMSSGEADRLEQEWGQLFDSSDMITDVGRAILPSTGLDPVPDGRTAGYLGIATSYIKMGQCSITSVDPGSPAEAAGLQPGFVII
jgi:hypothetical protein